MLPFLGDAFRDFTNINSVSIDNNVFRLHYIFTSIMLFSASGILITNQLFGDPIDCFSDSPYQKEDTYKQTIDNFCWVGATYTIPELYQHKYNALNSSTENIRKFFHFILLNCIQLCKIFVERSNALYDGVGQFDARSGHSKKEHLYYRWIFFMLFIEGILFYFPFYLWKSWENGRMKSLSEFFDSPFDPAMEYIVETISKHDGPAKDGRSLRLNQLLDSLESHEANSYEWYTYRLYFCEILNLAVTLGAFFATNSVLDHQFSQVGFEIMKFGWTESTIVDRLFPIHAKCLWRTVGPSGSNQDHDALCLLPLNTINRWTFKLLW
jgi:hypothetical protein